MIMMIVVDGDDNSWLRWWWLRCQWWCHWLYWYIVI